MFINPLVHILLLFSSSSLPRESPKDGEEVRKEEFNPTISTPLFLLPPSPSPILPLQPLLSYSFLLLLLILFTSLIIHFSSSSIIHSFSSFSSSSLSQRKMEVTLNSSHSPTCFHSSSWSHSASHHSLLFIHFLSSSITSSIFLLHFSSSLLLKLLMKKRRYEWREDIEEEG